MSVIGPRPGLWNQDILTAERDKYNANDVKPGLTGWAQINGRDELEIPEKASIYVVWGNVLHVMRALIFTPQKFLMQHIQYVEKKCKRLARSVSFRNPLFDTEKFYFTLKDEGGIFYKKPVKSDDVYQIAYHSGISYRENCYSCNFANVFRQGDLTLGDFWSVGKTQEVEFEKKHISCILVNTEKGEKILKNLVKNNKIIIFERPIEEETRYERQLNSPTNKNEIREKFLKYYKLNKNFDKAMRKATFKIRYSNLIKTIIHYERIKTVLRVWIPQKYRTKFKQVKKNSKI